ncbi:MAG: class I SAM-dependent methyltransferase [Rhodospirillaceae bacterium]|nr:class I SAM-dependent methyltransferase [Rhodospirillaceae bacterium]
MINLISPEYAELNRQLHEDRADYGADAARNAKQIAQVARANKVRTILDYGCGKGALKGALAELAPELEVLEYDPAIPGKTTLPATPVDMVAALDVMEHIEPEHLEAVLASMRAASRWGVLLLITTVPATKNLPDGRNAHLILEPKDWWESRLGVYFKTALVQEGPTGFVYIGLCKP